MNLALINPRVWLELVVAALLVAAGWYGYHTIYERGAESVQVKWDAVEKERAQASAKVAADALQVTKDLQASADKQRGISNAQLTALNQSLATAVAGLSNRASRPDAGVVPGATTAEPATGCTGAGLYRGDAEAFIRESARANLVLADLAQCQAQYGAAYDALNKDSR